jgi:hypothetical protein
VLLFGCGDAGLECCVGLGVFFEEGCLFGLGEVSVEGEVKLENINGLGNDTTVTDCKWAKES